MSPMPLTKFYTYGVLTFDIIIYAAQYNEVRELTYLHSTMQRGEGIASEFHRATFMIQQ